MTLIRSMLDAVTYVLVAFTAISLIVSSVMIGVITYVSVVERTKEIGVLRSLGARKKDIRHLFNAETFLIGLFAGAIGVGVTYLLSIPIISC
ncbi:MAG: ABC transporter permease [Christensenellaceae bacterium]